MAYCQIFEHPDLTPEKMEQVMAHVRTAGAVLPEGARLLVAGPGDPGMRMITIWDSILRKTCARVTSSAARRPIAESSAVLLPLALPWLGVFVSQDPRIDHDSSPPRARLGSANRGKRHDAGRDQARPVTQL
jgi:hypothetical protein